MPIQAKAKVLIVDDERVHRFMLRSMFAEWGWDTTEADDGTTAVAAVEQGPFDAILMDVRMTTMDGMEALQRIHAINPAIPVVIMTAFSSVDSAVAAIKQGAHDYLTKPLDFDRLRTTLEVAMGHRQRDADSHDIGQPFGNDGRIIGKSAPMQELWEMIVHVAPTEATVLINGE
nr:response regulator [Desulfobulbus sp.]